MGRKRKLNVARYAEPELQAAQARHGIRDERWTQETYRKLFGPAAWPALYVMEVGQGLVKIGISEHPNRRVAQIQTAQSQPVKLFWTIRCKTAREVEQTVHRYFRKSANHARGEWYHMQPETAVRVIQAAIKTMNAETFPDVLWHADRGL